MANKTYFTSSIVNAGDTDIYEFPVIEVGKTWVIISMTCGDIQFTNDGASSVYALQWGSSGSWDTVEFVSLSGNTMQISIGEEYAGDGTKKFRLVRINKSALNDKELPCKIKAYSRE